MLKFMKDQGLRQASFNSIGDIQNALMERQIYTTDSDKPSLDYFYKAYETFTML
jgi:hypothetical protein